MKWINKLDLAEDSVLNTCNIVIRPHPKFRDQWTGVDLGKNGRRIAICTSTLLNNDQLLFDTLYFSSVVVGLNTSAQLEAAVLGKPVVTIQVPEYSHGQEGTIHFHYLLKENGGFVERSDDLESHVQHLHAILNDQYDKQSINNFVKNFIRPQGIQKPAVQATAEAIELFSMRMKRELLGQVVPQRQISPRVSDLITYFHSRCRRFITSCIKSL
jgi:hypothetical protein